MTISIWRVVFVVPFHGDSRTTERVIEPITFSLFFETLWHAGLSSRTRWRRRQNIAMVSSSGDVKKMRWAGHGRLAVLIFTWFPFLHRRVCLLACSSSVDDGHGGSSSEHQPGAQSAHPPAGKAVTSTSSKHPAKEPKIKHPPSSFLSCWLGMAWRRLSFLFVFFRSCPSWKCRWNSVPNRVVESSFWATFFSRKEKQTVTVNCLTSAGRVTWQKWK